MSMHQNHLETKNNRNIEIFDLDGTLTQEFSSTIGDLTKSGLQTYSFWNLITRNLASDQHDFDEKANAWKKMVTTTPNIDKVASSKEMTEIGINLLRKENQNAAAIRNKAKEITLLFFKHKIIHFLAIEYLLNRLQQDVACVISTASYEDGAHGFVDGLVECGLIPKELARKIIISGTQIEWQSLKVTHMNAGYNKLHGLVNALQKPITEIKPYITAIFADDPEINDRSLLNGLCKHCFVIKTEKNTNMHLPAECVFTSWEEVYTCRNNITELHKRIKL